MAENNTEKIYENLKSIEEWAFAGMSQKEMAEMLGMSYSTFRKLKGEISALSALLKKSADVLKERQKKELEQVEASLLQRCLGYNASVKKFVKLKKPILDAEGQMILEKGKPLTEEVLEEVTEEQHVPADIGAVKFYLLNKARKDWKNDPERLAIEKKRLANDTKRTQIAEANASTQSAEGKTIEEYLDAAELEEGAADA